MAENYSGECGELWVIGHLKGLGFPSGLINNGQIDAVAKIGGIWRTFQIKTSTSGFHFSKSPYWGAKNDGAKQKKLSEYEVDAFAFISFPVPYPRYIAIDGMSDNINMGPGDFTRAARDWSFDELLRRWGILTL